MQQCSDNVPPVIRTFIGRNGNEINIRYHGTWEDLCRNYVKSLPQKRAAKQEAKDVSMDSDRVLDRA